MIPHAAGPVAGRPKPKLSFWEIWNMSFGFLGIQIGFGLQNANVSRISRSTTRVRTGWAQASACTTESPRWWPRDPASGAANQPRGAHAICLMCGALGLLSILLLKDPRLLLGSMIGVGIAWASILSMPYAILTGSLPPSKMGTT